MRAFMRMHVIPAARARRANPEKGWLTGDDVRPCWPRVVVALQEPAGLSARTDDAVPTSPGEFGGGGSR
jgi:hypothetical protein